MTTLDMPSVALESRHNLPKQPGLYFVVGDAGTIVYIGRARNIYARWAQHHRLTQMQKGVHRIYWEILPVEVLVEAETAAIAAHKPAWNLATVVTGREVVLPANIHQMALQLADEMNSAVESAVCDAVQQLWRQKVARKLGQE